MIPAQIKHRLARCRVRDEPTSARPRSRICRCSYPRPGS